jgi:hypothetical protein
MAQRPKNQFGQDEIGKAQGKTLLLPVTKKYFSLHSDLK